MGWLAGAEILGIKPDPVSRSEYGCEKPASVRSFGMSFLSSIHFNAEMVIDLIELTNCLYCTGIVMVIAYGRGQIYLLLVRVEDIQSEKWGYSCHL